MTCRAFSPAIKSTKVDDSAAIECNFFRVARDKKRSLSSVPGANLRQSNARCIDTFGIETFFAFFPAVRRLFISRFRAGVNPRRCSLLVVSDGLLVGSFEQHVPFVTGDISTILHIRTTSFVRSRTFGFCIQNVWPGVGVLGWIYTLKIIWNWHRHRFDIFLIHIILLSIFILLLNNRFNFKFFWYIEKIIKILIIDKSIYQSEFCDFFEKKVSSLESEFHQNTYTTIFSKRVERDWQVKRTRHKKRYWEYIKFWF